MSWIHVRDLTDIILYVINNPVSGDVNAVSPNPVTNSEFTVALGSAINRQALIPVPAFILKTVFGEMSDILLKSQKVVPKKLLNSDFNFSYPSILPALEHLL